MAIEKVMDFFGVKALIFYDLATFVPLGLFRVIGDFNFERTKENVLLTGGNAEGAFDAEFGQPENSIASTLREVPSWAYSALEGATITPTAAETLGFVGTATNKSGTSVVDATTGIASITAKAGSEANIRGIRYVLKATGADTVDIYVHSEGPYDNIQARVAIGVVVPGTGGTVDVDELGITITGGSGAIAFVTDDTGSVLTRPIHAGFNVIKVGSEASVVNEFGIICITPRQASGIQFWIDIHRVKASGIPFNLTSREWSEWALTATPLIDCAEDALYTMYQKLPDVQCA